MVLRRGVRQLGFLFKRITLAAVLRYTGDGGRVEAKRSVGGLLQYLHER